MALTALQVLGISAFSYVLWRTIVRPLVVKSPLDDLPGPPAQSRFAGNLLRVLALDSEDFHLELAQRYGPVANLKGLFGKPALYVYDPKALQSVLVRDQNAYKEPSITTSLTSILFGPGLLANAGDVHKKQRKMLNPVFSPAHMRNLLPVFYEIAGKLRTAIEAHVANGLIEINIAEWMGRVALELIGEAGFGTSFDPLTEDTQDSYATALKLLPAACLGLGPLVFFFPFLPSLGPPSFRRALLRLIPNRTIRQVETLVDTMHERSVKIYHQRKAALEKGEGALSSQIAGGKDIMSVLIKANMESSEQDRLSEDEVIAQISTLSFAGTDTTSNMLSRILWLLSHNLDMQQRLREEIIQAQEERGELQYDALMTLPFLDAVCRESLRLYPPALLNSRVATKDVLLPLSEPIRTKKGQELYALLIPEGTEIFVGVSGWNANKAVWGEDALEWKPERWLQPLPAAVTEAHVPAVYSNMMTFFGGGRACIGFKFSEMEMKVILATLLPRFTFEPTDKNIVWNVAVVRYPSVGVHSQKNELPLKVGLYQPTGQLI